MGAGCALPPSYLPHPSPPLASYLPRRLKDLIRTPSSWFRGARDAKTYLSLVRVVAARTVCRKPVDLFNESPHGNLGVCSAERRLGADACIRQHCL